MKLLFLQYGMYSTAYGITKRHLYGASVLGGIGFTMSIFVSSLSFADEAIDAAFVRIDEIEKMASNTIETSDISKINQAAGKEYVKVKPEVIKMLKTSVKYSELSNGAFDIIIEPLIKLWGIGTDNERIPTDEEIKSKLPLVGYNNISINEEVYL